MSKHRSQPGKAEHEMVDAVVILRQVGSRGADAPSATAARVQALLKEASAKTGLDAEDSVFFEHMNSFSLRAPAAFVEAIARAPDVEQLIDNSHGGLELIRPVSRKTVDLDDPEALSGVVHPPKANPGKQ